MRGGTPPWCWGKPSAGSTAAAFPNTDETRRSCQQPSGEPLKLLSTRVRELVQKSHPAALKGSGGPAALVCVFVPVPLLCWGPATRRPRVRQAGNSPAAAEASSPRVCRFPHCWNSTPVCLLVPVWLRPPRFLNLFPLTTHKETSLSSNKTPEATTALFVVYRN